METIGHDLQEFLQRWEERYPGEVVHVEKEVSTRYEITATQLALLKQRRTPILVFHDVTTERGVKSRWPVVTNLLCSRRRCAEAAGTTMRTAAPDLARRVERGRLPPLVISPDKAPCKQVKLRVPQDISLWDLPAVRHYAMDGGPFITGGLFTTRDPDRHTYNSSFHRNNIWEDARAGINFGPRSHSGVIFRKFETKGQDMPVAVCVGHHPALLLGAQTRMEQGGDHYETMGAFAGEPLRVVPSETLGDDFLVPADGQFVIEGYVPAGRRAAEGPLGEYHEYYGPQRWMPYFVPTCITHRTDALWHDVAVATPDHQLIGVFGIEQAIFQAVKRVVPSVQNVYMPTSGCCRFHAYIQIRKERINDGREAILAALLVDQRLKHVVVVDDDIDIFDERMVLWAIATRSQWDRDMLVLDRLTGSTWDPSALGESTTKGGIDATMPLASIEPFPIPLRTLRPSLPDEVQEKINERTVLDLLPEAAVGRMPLAPTGDI